MTTDGWLARWDRQQEVYIRDRERRYDVMLAFLEELAPSEPVVLDLAAGPGSTAVRVLDRLPGARCLAVDVDPVLQRIGRDAYGDAGGRLTWIKADLRDPSWPAALGVGGVDAVISTTALHWLRPEELAPLYRTLHGLLAASRGPFLNGDHLPFPRHAPRIRAAAERVDQRRRDDAVGVGAEDWAAWWDALRADPGLAAEHAERAGLWPEGSRGHTSASLAFHQAALDAAGFAESAIVWQDLDERVLLALP
ncbi:class I SAM-dependent methyltransferase [Jiangella alkaliphila]|uniref:Methyltransferase domain-containing protein n=1 Tax=Jiangella alkaliphila TaxID=419479 RepID=A0A1H2KH82_9ACTN|nr:class I SAM-dependent methyltransferase [Jiangella alkaliphila]SDU67778.1 Methyltransferase domain-containing protein [Jiangella alkaliphila]